MRCVVFSASVLALFTVRFDYLWVADSFLHVCRHSLQSDAVYRGVELVKMLW